MPEHERPVVLYKRWLLRPGVSLDDVVAVVRDDIAPHYRTLDPDAALDLESLGDGAVLAIQRWPSREQLDRAFSGPAYDAWWAAYQPILRTWDALVEFDDEWETERLIG